VTRFSLTMPLANSQAMPDSELYDEVDRRFGVADELGYDTVFTNEHHFTDYTVCPDTMVLLAYVAARTERIRLGTSVIVLPWHQPIRIAEQIAMVDVLSHGRVLPGLGRGTAIHEHEGLNSDPEESRDRFREAVEVMRLAFTGEPFDYEGPFHTYKSVTLRPRPPRPKIPMIGASTTPSSCALLGEMGLGIMLMGQGQLPADTFESLESWRSAYLGAGHDPADAETVYHGLGYVADTDEQAYEKVAALLPTALDTQLRHYEAFENRWLTTHAYRDQGELVQRMTAAMTDPDSFPRRLCDQLFVGSPETCARRIRTFVNGGFDHISLYLDWVGALPLDEILDQMQRFMTDVVPLVDQVEPEVVESEPVVIVNF
jgi:alkanesulfonate monooxygenase SsuD/methylene tetrahydromethanopterin reductase-like flavin-dependent oxidoreductase (luciferase family)